MRSTQAKTAMFTSAMLFCLFCESSFSLVAQNSSSAPTSKSSSEASSDQSQEKVYTVKEVTQRTIIRKRPAPSYTKKAKKNGVTGTVKLKVVLTSTGKVTNIEVVSGLPDGLTEKAIEAAKKIKFDPAMLNGRPVSQLTLLEYVFNLY